jgi:thiosulfate reductase cytochrome b subunit
MTKTELATDAVAVAAIASPWWLPVLQAIHDWAAWVLPVAGVAWLLLQAFTHIRSNYWRKPK